MTKKVFIIPIIAIIALTAIYISQQASLPDPNTILLSGNIEVTEVDISFKISGRMVKRLASEGERIQKKSEIALLEPDELQQEVLLREAELQAAQAALLELKEGYLPEEIAQAGAKLQQAKANFTRLQSDYDRQKTLFEGDVISNREFDVSSSAFEVAKAKVLEANEQFSLLKRGIRKEKIAQAVANVSKVKQTLALSKTRLGYTKIYSPISGYVLTDNVQDGEYVSPGTPVVTVANLENVWLRAYVDEKDLGKIKLGQTVKISVDSYPDKVYLGKVTFISSEAEFTPKNVQTEKERVTLVYRVKVDVPNENLELKPGMPADGMIVLDEQLET
jgi:membrane fusion protein YbhG